ncbi:glycosyltransferase [Larkinella sp. C7]|jgi:glycosyltransferase involved in cell wall biosynthesis|uniref:glycosyltransferase n=1 Tax=Larkinella sp. C7 TaxID=2576607 RepID=UPI0011112393|nr:glycosyltransferase [Larkinella sp. C7]
MSHHPSVAGGQSGHQESSKFDLSAQVISTTSARDITDLLCFSHLRWNFVYQRPQHLMSRASQQYRVWYWEEPVCDDHAWLEVRPVNPHLHVLVPHLPPGLTAEAGHELQRQWLNNLRVQHRIIDFISWYYTPMALAFTDQLRPRLTLYDCMDELSAFHGAPPALREREEELMHRAGLVFTGGYSLFEAKQQRHRSVHAFPSSIDNPHFAQARQGLADPADHAGIAYPRAGYSGVIDERLDLTLLRELASRQPDWQFILLGPVVKIDPATLPQGPNLHYLGMKPYEALPAYFSNWQVALLPFARNEATRFISPTKTPEYLAAGLPVVSTPIRDVVTTYGDYAPVWIADTVWGFEQAMAEALQEQAESDWAPIDAHLQQQSWDLTWASMNGLIKNQLKPSENAVAHAFLPE